MSGTTTPNLGLFNTNMLTDGDDYFDFDRDLNQNNNILDAAIGKLSTLTTEEKTSLVAAINELVAGKSSIDLDNLSAIGQAIMDKKVEVEALLQQNGYAKFTWKENNQISNLTIQWGSYYFSNLAANGYMQDVITFPIAFNNYSLTGAAIAAAHNILIGLGQFQNNQVTINIKNMTTTAITTTHTIKYIIIGY